MADDDTTAADARFMEWMRLNLQRAADHFGLNVTGQPVFGWRLRSIGATASTTDWQPRWLRVVSEFPQWASGTTWTGNLDANAITDLPKPRVMDVHEWDEQNWRHQRAEVLTLLPGAPVAATSHLTEHVRLQPDWWQALRQAIDTTRATPTQRTNCDAATLARRSGNAYGMELTTQAWETVHGDLHWQNLLAPEFGLLDWELWGTGPAGTDAATLLLHSLLVPDVYDRVYQTFADQLDSDSGRIAQLSAGARLLSRIRGGDFPELERPLRRHLRRIGAPVPESC
jgi:hypothetical protein